MVAYPWYLLAVGLVIVVIGGSAHQVWRFVAAPQQPLINHKMKDREIIERLGREQRIPFLRLVLLIRCSASRRASIWDSCKLSHPTFVSRPESRGTESVSEVAFKVTS